jgi:crotonobetainyl-CoA:carnitine CoA-transferase CaiB-like acyl-CoA transferase
VPDGSLPLADVLVLDLSDESTVFGTRLLADLGARVVRVEDVSGDVIRSRGPFLHDLPGIERGLAHLLYHAGKESVALDLESQVSWQVVERIARDCDVVVGPCGTRREIVALFDSLETLGDDAPGIVEVVFRRGNPDEVATDLIGTAAGGLLVLGGVSEDPPNHPKGDLAYKQTSLAAAEAALALVLEKRCTGRAGRIVVSMQEAVNLTTVQTANANIHHWHGRVPTRHTPVSPFTIHRTGDGLWVSFTIHPPNWPRYAEWIESKLGTSDLSTGEWADSVYRATHVREMSDYTRRLLAQYTRVEAIIEGQKRGLLVLPVNTIADIAADRHLQARGFFRSLPHPQLDQPLNTFRSPFRSNTWKSRPEPAPTLGQHTAEVLGSVAGLSAKEINSLIDQGVAYGARASENVPPSPGARPRRIQPVHGERRQPLTGVRILDFCWAIAGPLATRLLADLGADVIKVESAYRLDPIRGIGVQPPRQVSWNTNGQFNDCNVNKRAICLNLNTQEGVEIALRLAATADVVTSNYTPDRLERWGLSYEALRGVKPNIILANLAVMGTSGPHMGWRSYGSGIVAMCGIGSLTGFPGRDPIGIGTLHTDFTVPYFAATAIMAAIHQRRRTGEGQYLELSQYEASLHLLDTELVHYLNGGPEPERNGNRSPRMVPHGAFPSAGDDRWVAIACRNDADWSRLSEATGIAGPPDLAGRLAEVNAIEAQLSEWTRTRENWDAAAELQRAGVPASPVEDLSELLGRDVAMNHDYRLLALPSGISAAVQEEPILWDGERLPLVRAPLWDEHTIEVLVNELGLSDEEVAGLLTKDVLF